MPLTGLLIWPILSRYLEPDAFSQILIISSTAGWILAISSFGLTTRGVTTIATSDDAEETAQSFFFLSLAVAVVLSIFVLVILSFSATPTVMLMLLLVYTLCAPTNLDWIYHGNDDYRRPFIKNVVARLFSFSIVIYLVLTNVTDSFWFSTALIFPLVFVNIILYRQNLSKIFNRGFRQVNIKQSAGLLFWPGMQRVATSTFANLDVLLVPLYFANYQSAALLYIYRIIKVMLGLMLGGFTSLLPKLAKHAFDQSSGDRPLPIGMVIGLVSVCAIILSFGILYFEERFLGFLGADKMPNAPAILWILAFAIVPMVLNNILVNMILYPRKKEKLVLISSFLLIVLVACGIPFCKNLLQVAWLFLGAESALMFINGWFAWREK